MICISKLLPKLSGKLLLPTFAYFCRCWTSEKNSVILLPSNRGWIFRARKHDRKRQRGFCAQKHPRNFVLVAYLTRGVFSLLAAFQIETSVYDAFFSLRNFWSFFVFLGGTDRWIKCNVRRRGYDAKAKTIFLCLRVRNFAARNCVSQCFSRKQT